MARLAPSLAPSTFAGVSPNPKIAIRVVVGVPEQPQDRANDPDGQVEQAQNERDDEYGAAEDSPTASRAFERLGRQPPRPPRPVSRLPDPLERGVPTQCRAWPSPHQLVLVAAYLLVLAGASAAVVDSCAAAVGCLSRITVLRLKFLLVVVGGGDCWSLEGCAYSVLGSHIWPGVIETLYGVIEQVAKMILGGVCRCSRRPQRLIGFGCGDASFHASGARGRSRGARRHRDWSCGGA